MATMAGGHAQSGVSAVCGRVLRPVSAGDFVSARDFETARCPTPVPGRSFGYDPAARLSRADRDLAAGEVVRQPPAFALALYRPGDRVRLAAVSGPVRVEREVEVVAPARQGQPVLVRGGAGKPFQVSFDEIRP